jgi:hypothetical protein
VEPANNPHCAPCQSHNKRAVSEILSERPITWIEPGRVPGRKKFLGIRALAAPGIRMALRKVRGGLAMNEHELLATALGIDALAEKTGR